MSSPAVHASEIIAQSTWLHFPWLVLMDLEIQDFIYKFYKPCPQGGLPMKKKGTHIPVSRLCSSWENNEMVRKWSTKKTASTYLIGIALGRASTGWKQSQHSLFYMGGDKGELFPAE